MVTARGIYYDLNETIYYYKALNYKFYFSSKQYRDKFIKLHKDYIKFELLKFYQKYNLELTNGTIFLFQLYNIIEKRGFLVEEINTKDRFYKLPKIEINIVKE